jgi:hypothetical protein
LWKVGPDYPVRRLASQFSRIEWLSGSIVVKGDSHPGIRLYVKRLLIQIIYTKSKAATDFHSAEKKTFNLGR